jgi:signal transduction histidine kinase
MFNPMNFRLHIRDYFGLWNSKLMIGLSFLMTIIFMFGIVVVGVYFMSKIHGDMSNIVTVRNTKIELVSQMMVIGRDRSNAIYRMALMKDAFELDEEIQNFSAYASAFISTREKFEAVGLEADEMTVYKKVLAEVNVASPKQLELVEIMQLGSRGASFDVLLKQAVAAQREVENKFNEIVELERMLVLDAFKRATSSYHTALIVMLVLGLSTGALSVVIAVFVVRQANQFEQQLRDANTNLEAKVLQRTEALEASKQELQEVVKTLSQTQEELIQSGKMASLGSLVAGISHEINTPLGIGVTSATSVQEQVKALKHEFELGVFKRSTLEDFFVHVTEAADILVRNLMRAAELIRSFKQVAVDQSSEEYRTINFREYVDEIILSMRPKLKSARIVVDNDCDQDLVVRTLPGVIFQILSNFIMNSLVHAYDAGQAGVIKITSHLDGEKIILVYSDDGKGISEVNIANVFDPFFTTKRGQGGSGLGLNIVYNLVKNSLHGSISVESKLGSGTIFSIKFPAHLGGKL